MKISQQQLNDIIREEVQAALKEVNPVPTPTSSKGDLTKLQGTKGLGKQKEVPDPKVKERPQEVVPIKSTAAVKKKAQQSIKKGAQSGSKYAKAIEAERKRKAAGKKAKAEKAKRSKRA
tara:strand:- start:926 stop:1282 length:357 start_codon:yes stop_codon:yes gene_type:complete